MFRPSDREFFIRGLLFFDVAHPPYSHTRVRRRKKNRIRKGRGKEKNAYRVLLSPTAGSQDMQNTASAFTWNYIIYIPKTITPPRVVCETLHFPMESFAIRTHHLYPRHLKRCAQLRAALMSLDATLTVMVSEQWGPAPVIASVRIRAVLQ
jgi:hypothetical protein